MTLLLDRFFFRPLTVSQILFLAMLLTVLTTAYCMAYTGLAGRMESPLEGIIWAMLNIIPWLFCYEIAKRQTRWPMRSAVVGMFVIGMALIDVAVAPGREDLFTAAGFEITRRIPGAGLVVALLFFAGMLKRLARIREQKRAAAGELPLLPSQIEWVRAAGNYVELHGPGSPVLYRASISSVARKLDDHGFVRIHRSVLVPRRNIADISGGIVTLRCGRAFKIGNRYRSALSRAAHQPAI